MTKANHLSQRLRFWKAFICVTLVAFFYAFTASAQLTNVPVTGFNADVVGNGVGVGTTSTTADVDGVGWIFVNNTFNPGAGVCASGTTAMPANNTINSLTTPGLSYLLQPYNANNSLRLTTGTSGTLTLSTPTSATNIYFLALGGSGACAITATVNFSDGTTQVITGNAGDWCGGVSPATGIFYRISRTATTCTGGSCQYLYDVNFALSPANYSKTITSILVASTGGVLNVMGVGALIPCAGTPTPGNTIASANPACSAVNFTLSLQNSTGGGATYQWQSSPDGITWANISGATSSTRVASQTASTYYRCVVTCGANTANSNPVLVNMAAANTCYCANTGGSAAYYINNFSTTGGTANITNNGTGFTAGGYANYTAIVAQQLQGSAVNFSITGGGTYTYGFGIWVDWNQNGSFADAGDQVYNSGAYLASTTGSFTVPLTALTGNTRMRVVSNYLSTAPVACTGTAYTECEDYTFNVVLLSPCTTPSAQPSAPVLTTISTSQINGSFTAAAGPPSGYLVVRYPAGASETLPVNGTIYVANQSLGLGTIVQVSNATSFNNTGLNGGTAYDYYVYSYNNLCAGAPFYLTTGGFLGTQSTNACGTMSGVIPVGPTAPASPAGFPTLSGVGGALAYINTNGLGGNTILELQADYTTAYAATSETYPLTFSSNACVNATKTLTIRPAAAVSSPITLTSASTTATVDLNGATYITFDGRPDGIGVNKYLSIVNTSSTAAAAGNAVLFRNEARNNTLTYLDLKGSNLNPAGNTGTVTIGAVPGVIAIMSTTGTLGNDNNMISFNDIHSVATSGNMLNVGIYAYNATTVGSLANNDNNTITNNNIFDCFHATTATANIDVLAGNNSYTITNNSFYKTASATFTYTAAVAQRGLWITPGASAVASSGFTISNNYFGGTAPLCGGAPYVTTAAVANIFNGMDVSVGTASTSSIQNNMMSNYTATTANTTATAWVGISIASGNIDIGTIAGNLIGSNSTNGAISFTTTANTGGLIGIRTGGGSTINIANNIISGINLLASVLTVTPVFNGINGAGGTTVNITNNTIGSASLANSINAVSATTGTTAQTIRGIIVNGGTTSTVTGNLIANINSNIAYLGAVAHTMVGIAVTVGTSTVSGNTIRNLTSSSQSTSGGSTPSVIGISYTSTTAPAIIRGNTIHTLKNTASTTTSGPVVAGIYYGGPSGTSNLIEKNSIHSLVLTSTTVNASAAITGMDIGTGQVTIKNNMVRLGFDENGNSIITPTLIRGITKNTNIANIYFNSIFIGGTGVLGTIAANTFAFTRTAAASTDDIRNNIFVNNRSNATTGGKHYQISLTSIATMTLNYNDYYGTGNGSVFGYNVTADVAAYTPGWVSGDISSQSGNPQFLNPTGSSTTGDLHINPSIQTPIEQQGQNIASVTEDFDGSIRLSNTPEDIGADAGNFIPVNACSGMPAAGVAAFTNTSAICGTGTKTINLSGITAQPGLTYQWQQSLTGLAGSFSNVSTGTGGTSVSYTTAALTSSSPLYFQCIVKCTITGDSSFSTIVQAIVNSAPVLTVTPATGTNVCSGSNVDLTASGAATYSWACNPGIAGYPMVSLLSTPNNLATVTARPTSTLASSTAAPPATAATPTWIYTVTGTDASGCSSTASITLNVITSAAVPLTLTYTSSPDPVCAPGTAVTLTVNNNGTIGAGQWVYNWYNNAGTTLLQTTTNALTSDSYTPSVAAANGNQAFTVKVSNTVCPSSYAVASPSYYVGFTSLNVATNSNCGDNGQIAVYPEGQTDFTDWYVNNFNAGLLGPAFDASFGNTNFTGGLCNITPQVNSQTGTLLVRNPANINTNNLQVDFLLSTAPRGFAYNILGADGMAWSYAADVYQGSGAGPGFQAESGSGTGFKLAFDATSNGAQNTPGCYLMYNCTTPDQGPTSPGVIAFKQGSFWQGLVNAPVSILISDNGYVTVTINNQVIFDHVPLPTAYLTANKSTWIHGFTARTGGSNELHAIDNLKIRYNSFEYSNNSTNGSDGSWQTENIFTGLAAGTYPIWVRKLNDPNCFSFTGNAVINVDPSPSSASTVPASGYSNIVCYGSGTTLTSSIFVPGAVFYWEQASSLAGPWTAASGTNSNASYITPGLTSNTYYRLTFTCPSSTPIIATPMLVTVNAGSIASTNSPQLVNCLGDNITVTAVPGPNTTCVWYATATGGSPLVTGNSYTSAPTTLPVTYYVEPVTTIYSNHYYNGGQTVIANTFGTASSSSNISTRFTTTASVTIDSIKVLPSATGTLNVALQNAGSATNIGSVNFTVTAAMLGNFVNVPVNLIVPGSGSYQLTTSGVACSYYSSYTGSYAAPYMSMGGVFTITGGALSATGAASTAYYGTAFRIAISSSCPAGNGARIPVLVQANPANAVTIAPSSTTLCVNSIQALTASSSASYSNYSWTPVTDLFIDAAATIAYVAGNNSSTVYLKPSTSGLKTYTASTVGSGCTNTAAVNITVIALPAVVATASPTAVCTSGNVQLNANVPGTSYTVTSIPFVPQPVPATASTIAGDEAIQTVNIGFTFGYFGNTYTNVILHTNGYIQLGGTTPTCLTCYTPPTAPSTAVPNNWVGIWADMSVTAGQVTYGTTGIAPNRKFIANYNSVNYFSATPASTHQIILNESDNSVEIHVTSNTTTSTNSRAMAIENADGTVAVVPPNRNAGTWTANNEAWKFSPVIGSYSYNWSANPMYLTTTNISNPVAQALSTPQTYTVQVLDATTGCSNTATVAVNVNYPTTSTSSTTSCNAYLWNGTSYTTAGTYTYTTINSVGCDSVATLNLTVNSSSSSSSSAIACGSYSWNATTYTATGIYTATSMNAAGCDSVMTLNLTMSCNSILNLTMYIEGYWDAASSLMLPVLANQGEASTAAACDSIDVELHSSTAPFGTVQTIRTILNQNGTAYCSFTSLLPANYYVAIKHRSAAQTWSAVPIAINNITPMSYNFSTAASQAFGDNQVEVATGVWAFYSGDIVVDENIDLLDLGYLETDISVFAYGYLPTDLNGDGNVDLLDSPILESNISNFIFAWHP